MVIFKGKYGMNSFNPYILNLNLVPSTVILLTLKVKKNVYNNLKEFIFFILINPDHGTDDIILYFL